MGYPAPKSYIQAIAPYVGGKSKLSGQEKVIKLSSNESSLGPSPKAVEAIKKALIRLYRYPDGGHAELKEAIGQSHGLNPDWLICGNGSDEILGLLMHAYAGPGDEIVYSQHGFLMYKIYAQAFGVTAVAAPETNLTADVDALLAAVTPKTRIMFVANPNNPTGSYLPTKEMERLRAGLRSGILLVIDAAYAEYPETPDYSDGRALVDAQPNTVMVRTFSKIYGLPLLRLGWAYAHSDVLDPLHRIRSPFNVNGMALDAGIAAVLDQAHIAEAKAWNNQCLKELPPLYEAMGIKVHPSVVNFLLLEFPDKPGKSAADANKYLLEKGIILRDVVSYGLPNCLRLTIGLGVENSVVVDALAAFMKR